MDKGRENISFTPVLVSRFDDIREEPEICPTVDAFQSIFSDDEYRLHCFEEAKKSFEFIFDKEKFITHLQREPNKESLTYLKEVRRYGLILRTFFQFNDSRHSCGGGLNRFLYFLGTHNDSYWLRISEKVKEEILSEINNFDYVLNFAEQEEFKNEVRRQLEIIDELIQQKELPVDKFHSLRKTLRLFSNLLQISAAENFGTELHWLFYVLCGLSTELGDIHDKIVQKDLKGKIRYSEEVVKISPHIREKFDKVRPFLNKVFGL